MNPARIAPRDLAVLDKAAALVLDAKARAAAWGKLERHELDAFRQLRDAGLLTKRANGTIPELDLAHTALRATVIWAQAAETCAIASGFLLDATRDLDTRRWAAGNIREAHAYAHRLAPAPVA